MTPWLVECGSDRLPGVPTLTEEEARDAIRAALEEWPVVAEQRDAMGAEFERAMGALKTYKERHFGVLEWPNATVRRTGHRMSVVAEQHRLRAAMLGRYADLMDLLAEWQMRHSVVCYRGMLFAWTERGMTEGAAVPGWREVV